MGTLQHVALSDLKNKLASHDHVQSIRSSLGGRRSRLLIGKIGRNQKLFDDILGGHSRLWKSCKTIVDYTRSKCRREYRYLEHGCILSAAPSILHADCACRCSYFGILLRCHRFPAVTTLSGDPSRIYQAARLARAQMHRSLVAGYSVLSILTKK